VRRLRTERIIAAQGAVISHNHKVWLSRTAVFTGLANSCH
jgi:hypothetical protein